MKKKRDTRDKIYTYSIYFASRYIFQKGKLHRFCWKVFDLQKQQTLNTLKTSTVIMDTTICVNISNDLRYYNLLSFTKHKLERRKKAPFPKKISKSILLFKKIFIRVILMEKKFWKYLSSLQTQRSKKYIGVLVKVGGAMCYCKIVFYAPMLTLERDRE